MPVEQAWPDRDSLEPACVTPCPGKKRLLEGVAGVYLIHLQQPLAHARHYLGHAVNLRGRIKIVAFQRGVTVADMLRELLAREFPSTEGDTP